MILGAAPRAQRGGFEPPLQRVPLQVAPAAQVLPRAVRGFIMATSFGTSAGPSHRAVFVTVMSPALPTL
jgi:hypothetical protein